MEVSDYFAELYVAGPFADAGWNVYFPHRDRGFDFIISKLHSEGGQVIRPVQVKGKYPTNEKGDKIVYGCVGRLTQTHPEMVFGDPILLEAGGFCSSLRRIHALGACANAPAWISM